MGQDDSTTPSARHFGILRRMSRRLLAPALMLLGPLALGCSGDPYAKAPPPAATPAPAGAADGAAAPTPGKAPDGKAPTGKAPDGKAGPRKGIVTKHDDGKPMGKVLPTAPLPIIKMLGESPPVVQTFLGPHVASSKGLVRDSCVRYIPDRTWFRCKFVSQRYTDKTNTFAVVHMTYEDGKATGISFENIPGAGKFDPVQALRKVGLELPGTPKAEAPENGVQVWRWFNAAARLMIHDRQYRVQVSSIEGGWDRAKVEIILNDPLNDSEKARAFDPKTEAPGGPAGG